MSYKPPIQHRAKVTEEKFLSAFDELMRENGFEQTTVDEIAQRAGLTRASLLARFGSKEQALLILYSRYCDRATKTMYKFMDELPLETDMLMVLENMSKQLLVLVVRDLSSNRAMHEHFLKNLETHDLTKGIFRTCVQMMTAVQNRFLEPGSFTANGAWSAAQLLVTIEFNSALQGMPGLPQDTNARHRLVAEILALALQK
jgi:AcrR family transcriptional regulator